VIVRPLPLTRRERLAAWWRDDGVIYAGMLITMALVGVVMWLTT